MSLNNHPLNEYQQKKKLYPTYKNSGIPWLGRIPSHWKMVPLRALFRFRKGGSAGKFTRSYIKANPGIYPVYSGQTSHEGILGYLGTYEFDEKQVIYTTTVGARVMTTSLIGGKFSLSQNGLIMRPKGRDLVPTFFFYQLTPLFEYERSMIPAHIQPSLRISDLNKYLVVLPSLSEQRTIASYLRRQTKKIDKLLAGKRRLIGLLNEKRKALISQTVSRGINVRKTQRANTPIRTDHVPDHWRIGKLKYMSSRIIDGVHSTPHYTGEGIPFLRITDIREGKPNLEDAKKISIEEHQRLTRRCHPQLGDMLLSKNGSVGLPCIVDWEEEFSIFVSLCAITFHSNLDVRFARYLFLSSVIEEQLLEHAKTSTVTNLHLDEIGNLTIPLPPLEEQRTIVRYLDNEVEKIGSLSVGIKKAINELEEYRFSLISAAVTGKIEIPKQQASPC